LCPYLFVTGVGLTKNTGTLYRSCAAVVNDNRDKDAKGVDVVLGIKSNTVSQFYPSHITKSTLGMCHGVTCLATDACE
jgi:hypothetical protein